MRIKTKGQSLIELLITIAVASILLPAFLTGFMATRSSRPQQQQRIQALSYLREAQEALKIVEANDWAGISNGVYHPQVSGSTWILTNGEESLASGNFTRTITISDVSRDGNGNIVASGGVVDPSTKFVSSKVAWNIPLASSVVADSYITRYSSLNHTDTTISDFSGTNQGTTVLATSGSLLPNDGQVQLGAESTGNGDWCSPNLSITALDLPKSGVANAITAIEGRAFTGTGENSSGVSFANVSISNANPPSATILGTFDGYKTNDIFGEENYAYFATDNNSKEIEIIDLTHLTNGKYSEAGYFNAPGNTDGSSVFVAGNIGYVAATNKLYTFDLTSKSGPRTQLGTVTLAGTGSKVFVVGNYVYVAIAGATEELQIIQVSNGGSTLSVVGQADVNGQAAYDVYVTQDGTRAYLATGVSSTQKEFFIIDTSSKIGNRPTIGSYEANGMDPKALTVVPGKKAILVGTGGEEYQVINILQEAQPVRCGGFQVNSGINGISSVKEQDGDVYSYIITGDATTEFKIIEGGPGNRVDTSGTYESPIFDAAKDVVFNKFQVNHQVSQEGSIQYQFAIAQAVSGGCSGAAFSYTDPFATTSATLPTTIAGNDAYKNPGRCVKYKASFTSNSSNYTPILNDITLNYSP